MFGNNKEAAKNKGTNIIPTSTTHSLNSLVHGTSLEGSIKSDSDIRIDGTVKGNIHCNAKLIIGPTGRVEGQVKCANAVIEGHFEGTLQVAELLNVRETAKISGDIQTSKLIVQAGAAFNVNCVIGGGQRSAGSNGAAAASEAKKIASSANV